MNQKQNNNMTKKKGQTTSRRVVEECTSDALKDFDPLLSVSAQQEICANKKIAKNPHH